MPIDNLSKRGSARSYALLERVIAYLETVEPEDLLRMTGGGKSLVLLHKALESSEIDGIASLKMRQMGAWHSACQVLLQGWPNLSQGVRWVPKDHQIFAFIPQGLGQKRCVSERVKDGIYA